MLPIFRFPHKVNLEQRDFHQELNAGKIDVENAEAKYQYGMLHLRQALRKIHTRRFEEAVEEVGKFHNQE